MIRIRIALTAENPGMTDTAPRTIVIDTDPGQDDAVAILLALASPKLNVAGITTVAGNVPLSHTTANAIRILDLAERADITVHVGADRPLVARAPVTGAHVHGPTGLDGSDLPAPSRAPASTDAPGFLARTLRERDPGSVTLVVLGPMTNIANLFTRAPDAFSRIRDIVWMGGACFEGGNITPSAEFNVYVDPEAADIVLRAGIPLTMVPLDVTHQCLTTPARLRRFAGLGNRAGQVVAGMLGFSERFDLAKYGWSGAPLHDPCTIAWLLRPDLFTSRSCHVGIECAGTFTRGATCVDYWHVTDRPPNVLYLKDVDADGFYDLLAERIARLP
jgi:purine nucleosidase